MEEKDIHANNVNTENVNTVSAASNVNNVLGKGRKGSNLFQMRMSRKASWWSCLLTHNLNIQDGKLQFISAISLCTGVWKLLIVSKKCEQSET